MDVEYWVDEGAGWMWAAGWMKVLGRCGGTGWIKMLGGCGVLG